jgi:hypothetical protein
MPEASKHTSTYTVVERKRHHRYLSGPTQASQRDATQNDDESQICLIQMEGS